MEEEEEEEEEEGILFVLDKRNNLTWSLSPCPSPHGPIFKTTTLKKI